MGRFIISPATPEDNEALIELCGAPMPGQISLAMERVPDYFAGAKVQNSEIRVFTGKDQASGRLAGIFSVGSRMVYVDSKPKMIPYFSDLRIHPDYQKSMLLYRLIRFVREQKILAPGTYAQTIVFADNSVMEALIRKTSNRPDSLIPRYLPAGDYLTHTIFFRRRDLPLRSSLQIRKAGQEDIGQMQAFLEKEAPNKQWYPHYDFERLTIDPYYRGLDIGQFYLAFQQETLAGITAIWDQQPFKQTRITGYQQPLRLLRPLVNRISPFQLPPPGTYLSYCSLSNILVRNNDPEIFRALVTRIYNDYRSRGYDYFLCGLAAQDPLHRAFEGFKAKRTILGKHYLVSFDPHPNPPTQDQIYYLEVARI